MGGWDGGGMKKCLFIIYLGGSIVLFNRERRINWGDKNEGGK